jgi:hypothetical protein
VAILLILLALLGVWGTSTGSSGPKSTTTHSSSSSVTTNQHVTVTSCVVVTWRQGSPAHRRACGRASATGPHTFRCTARLKVQLGAGVVESRRHCSGSPVKP